jgi:hypothetical protein
LKVGLREALRIILAVRRTVLLSEVTSMATERFSSTAPIKFGRYAVKFVIAPAREPAPQTKASPETSDFLREDLVERLRNAGLILDFYVQFYVDDTRTPIEDTSVFWQPDDAPLLKVAELHIDGPVDPILTEKINRLSFTPWHTTEDHRPLGNVMRARRVAYLASAKSRNADPEPAAPP